jgi:hypothetical protein
MQSDKIRKPMDGNLVRLTLQLRSVAFASIGSQNLSSYLVFFFIQDIALLRRRAAGSVPVIIARNLLIIYTLLGLIFRYRGVF